MKWVTREHPKTDAARSAIDLEQRILKRQLLEGKAPTRAVTVRRDEARTTGTETLMSTIDPALLDHLDEDAFKHEIEEILKQMQM